MTSGAGNKTAEAGAVELLTEAWYGTITTGAARKTFAFLESPTFTGTLTASGTLAVTGATTLSSTLKLAAYTVATLPAAATVGRIAYVTDALAPTYNAVIVGGGAVLTLVFDNGTNWTAH